MIWVHPDDIVVPQNRFRRDFDAKKLEELKASISRNGLLHPITIERQRDTDKWWLRAGERRLRVLSDIVKGGGSIRCGLEGADGGLIPAVEYDTLSPLERLEVEVEENVIRADFTWQERSVAIAKLHELRRAQNPQQTVTETATEIRGKPARGNQVSSVSDALVVARHLGNPEVAKAKDQKEAVKIIQRQAEALKRARLAKTFDLTKVEHKIVKADSLAWLPTVPEGSFDVILTDPPYGIDADSFGDMADNEHRYEDSYKWWKEKFLAVCPDEWYRVAKPQAHAYVFCDPRRFEELALHMALAKWKVFPTPLIWYKAGGMLPLPKHGPRRTYETILYAYKGDREVLVVKNDCITKIPGVKRLRHAAQKPVALLCDLFSRSANPGDTVLDNFGGAGGILVAANRSRVVATYVDDKQENYDIAVTRSTVKEIDDGAEEDDGLSIDFTKGALDGAVPGGQ